MTDGFDRPGHYPEGRPRAATVRSRLMLEIATELVGRADFDPKQVRIQFRPQGSDSWHVALFGSDAASAISGVADGETDIAIINPATAISRAVRGAPPFSEPVPLRAIATIPSYDQLGLAVAADTGIETFDDLIRLRPPLKVSLRGDRPDHSVHAIVDDVLESAGISLDDLRSWGGTIGYEPGLPHQGSRASAIRNRTVDAVFDEGIYNWVDLACESGFRFISLDDSAQTRLGDLGYRPATIAAADYEKLDQDVDTIDFSGFMIYTHERTSDELITQFCEAMESRGDRIAWQGGDHLPLRQMVTDTIDAPIPIPFHRAAEAFWRARGYLG